MRISDWSSDVCSSDLCPYPDFGNADKRYVTPALEPIRSVLRPYKDWLNTAGVLLVVALGLAFISRRQRRPEERRVGKVCGSTCRYRGSLYYSKIIDHILTKAHVEQ